MADAENLEIELENSGGTQASGSGGPSSKNVEKLPEGAVDWVFLALEQYGGDIHIPAFDEDANRVIEGAEAELAGVDDGTPLSAESLFGLSTDREYIGNPTIDSEGDETVKLVDEEGNDSVDRHFTINVAKSLNGHYTDRVVDTFGDDTHLRVGMGSSTKFDDPYVRAKQVRIKTTTGGDTSRRKRFRAMWDAEGTGVTQSDFEEMCEEADIPPYGAVNGDDE